MSDPTDAIGLLSKKVAELSVGQVKKPAGSGGRKCEFQTNLSTLHLKPNVPYFKYDVHMLIQFGEGKPKELTKITKEDFPEQSRKALTVALYIRLLVDKTHGAFFGKEKTVFYDRAKLLYTLKELPVDKSGVKVFSLPASFYAAPEMTGITGYEITISKVKDSFQANSNELLKPEVDRTLLEVLQIILCQTALMNSQQFISYGDQTHYLFDPESAGFSDRDFVALPDGKYLGAGAKVSTKVLEGSDKKGAAFVAVEVKKSAFHVDHQNLLDKIKSLSIFGRGQFDINGATARKESIAPQLRDLFVYTKYGESKQKFPIASLGGSASTTTFTIDGKKMTVEKYFLQKYKIQLKYPGLFLVLPRNGKGAYPVELLFVCPSQRVSRTQETPDQTAATIKACATLPELRLRQTKNLKTALKLVETNPSLTNAGVKVSNDLQKVPGRVLPFPKIVMKQNNKFVTLDHTGKFNGSQFVDGRKLNKWALFGLFLPGDSNFDLKTYASMLQSEMRASGMDCVAPMRIEPIQRPNEATIDKIMATAAQQECQVVFFVSSDNIKLHTYIKSVEAKCGKVVTQEVKVSKANGVIIKNQRQTLHNVIMKTNEKLGGINHKVFDEKKYLDENSRLFIGFEISNAPPANQPNVTDDTSRMPSVVGYAANFQKEPQYYLGDYRYVPARQADLIGDQLAAIVIDILKKFRVSRGVIPKHIVFMFTGVTEVQYENLIVNKYMKSVSSAIGASLSLQYSPQLTCFAVTKEHSERLFATSFNGRSAPEQNIQPGSVVDSVIVSKKYSEFYLNSHFTLQGTAKTPKYTIIMDSSPYTLDDWQNIMFALSYRHGIINSPISLAAPLYIAGRYSKRGHDVWIASQSSGDVFSIEEANVKLTNDKKMTGSVRVNA